MARMTMEERGTGHPTEYTTGTTTVGLTAEDGVVLAADLWASIGGRFVGSKDATKVFEVTPSAAVTISGSVGDGQAFVRRLRSEARMFELERGRRTSVETLATVAGELLRGAGRSRCSAASTTNRSCTSSTPAAASSPTPKRPPAAGRTAYGVLERRFEEGLGLEEAVGVARDAVAASSERDTASGNGDLVAQVTADGVDFLGGAA